MPLNIGDNIYMTPAVQEIMAGAATMGKPSEGTVIIIKGIGGPVELQGETVFVDEVGNVVDILDR